MLNLREKIAYVSRWWIAMILTSFTTGVLLIYAEPGNQWCAAAIVIGLGTSAWFALEAAARHYERYRDDAQDNTRAVLVFLVASLAGIGLAMWLQAPQVVQALFSGACSTSLFLLYKNYRVSDHKHHYGNRRG